MQRGADGRRRLLLLLLQLLLLLLLLLLQLLLLLLVRRDCRRVLLVLLLLLLLLMVRGDGRSLPALLAEQLQALCVHTPGYGTVSATMLAVGPAGVARYLFADGPPCRAGFVDHTALLAGALAQRP